jgi:hypothetical protein
LKDGEESGDEDPWETHDFQKEKKKLAVKV